MKYEVRSRRYESSLATGGYSYLVLHTSYFMLYAIIPNDIGKLRGGEGLHYLGNKFSPPADTDLRRADPAQESRKSPLSWPLGVV